MAKYTVTNNAPGPRGLNTGENGAGYLELAPGQTVENVVLNDAEHASADEAGYFTFGGKVADPAKAPAAPKAPGDTDGDGLPNNMPKLKGIAKAEGVDLTGKTTVAEMQAAILAARKAKADQANAPADDLDKLDDNTLLATVAAITGKPVADLEGTDRAGLLALARKPE